MASGRAVGIALLLSGVLALAIIFMATGSGSSGSGNFEPSPSPSQGSFDVCRASAGSLPPGFVLRERNTRNLGSQVMGESVAYGGGGRSVQVHIGYDAVDAAEDLDFEVIDDRLLGRREVEVLVAKSVPSILAAGWEEPGIVPPCNELTVMSRGLSEDELFVVVAGVKATGPRIR